MTESVTRKDFLGRTVITERAGYGGSMLVTSNAFDAAGRLVFTQNHERNRGRISTLDK